MSSVNKTEECSTGEHSYEFQWVCQFVATEGVFGVLGNSLVCFVVFRVAFLHSTTNYLLVNLAVADALICLQTFAFHLVAAPYCTLVRLVPHSTAARQLFCRLLATNYLGWSLSYITSYSLCLITIERYVAIVHPLHYARVVTASRVWRLVTVIWLLSFVLAAPFLATNGPSEDPCRACAGIWYPHPSYPVLVGCLSCLLAFVLPVTCMSWAYFRIQRALKKQAEALRHREARQAAGGLVRARQRLVSALTLVLGALAVFWTPLYLLSLLCLHPTQSATVSFPVCSSTGYLCARGVCRALFYLNSVINPVIYEFKYKRFRQGLKIACCCCCCSRGVAGRYPSNRVDSIGMH